jgi:hypothetical protein
MEVVDLNGGVFFFAAAAASAMQTNDCCTNMVSFCSGKNRNT